MSVSCVLLVCCRIINLCTGSRVVRWVAPDSEKTGSRQPSTPRAKKAATLSSDQGAVQLQ